MICAWKNFRNLITFVTFKIRSYFPKYLKTERKAWRKNFHIILENALRHARLGAIHWCLSKAIILLTMQAEIVDLFKQTLIEEFIWVNTRWPLDSKVLLPKNSQYQPQENLKLIYKPKTDIKNIFKDKRVVTKILKIYENNSVSKCND